MNMKDYREQLKHEIDEQTDIEVLNSYLRNLTLEQFREGDFTLYEFLQREPTPAEKMLSIMHRNRAALKEMITIIHADQKITVKELLEKLKKEGLAVEIFLGSFMHDLISLLTKAASGKEPL